ncbi:DUF2382 domain-containing protein [Pseudonocardia sp. TRM90224]|uniref:DUF2382 domain-containing protein n=1 Tax=Pseudonocardia sp. TRM90224 TaxID=2812678 RepID=UPI001E49E26D|nr:PRC and DUF2382 domain-containing protein [Pseudonocardia sp. TRM90224]
MITQDMIPQIVGQQAYDRDGQKIGKVGQIFVDGQDGSPKWASVNTGLFGLTESFVPLERADMHDRDLTLAVSKDEVKDAPKVDDSADHISVEEERRLTRHYARWLNGGGRDSGRDMHRDGGMTRSEERLSVGTESHETGTVRLRKYVVTEQQKVNVPVSHEEVRVEREPVRDGDRAARGPRIGEDVQEVTLHAERPVVDKRVEAVERVRLGTEKVTEDHTVSEKVRKEQVEVDDPKHQLRR